MAWRKVITHRSPDFDACAATYILLREAVGTLELAKEIEVLFRSVYDPPEQGAVYVDMTPGNGTVELPEGTEVIDHHVENRDRTATQLVWERYGFKPEYRTLVAESRYQDRLDHLRSAGITMGDLLGFARRGGDGDLDALLWMHRFFDSVVGSRNPTAAAKPMNVAAAKVAYSWAGDKNEYKIAYYSSPPEPHMNAALFRERDVSFIVYENPPYSMGVVRSDKVEIDLRGLAVWISPAVGSNEAREWFYHQNGFLACRGTTKSPAPSPSRLTLGELVRLVGQFINSLTAMKEAAGKETGT